MRIFTKMPDYALKGLWYMRVHFKQFSKKAIFFPSLFSNFKLRYKSYGNVSLMCVC